MKLPQGTNSAFRRAPRRWTWTRWADPLPDLRLDLHLALPDRRRWPGIRCPSGLAMRKCCGRVSEFLALRGLTYFRRRSRPPRLADTRDE